VKKGDPLVLIDPKELKSNIQALKSTLLAQKSDLAVAKSIYERNIKLYNIGGLPKEKLELSKVALKAKKAALESTTQKISQANHQLSYLSIKAPFDGIVDALLLQEGDLAAAGRPILSLSDKRQKLLFSYSPTKSSKITPGKKVYLNDKEIGEVDTIYNTSKNGLVTAEVFLKEPLSMPIGSSVNIEVLISKDQGCKIPQDSLLHKSDGVYVMEYKDSKFTPFKVEITSSNENFAIVSPCPKNRVAKGSEAMLIKLPAYGKVDTVGADDE
jgi:RND family efflux transporter MFP subunit